MRCLKPKTIVQAGVSNGLSSAFMMLALAKNGPEGRFYAIDLPHIFNPADRAWTKRGEALRRADSRRAVVGLARA